MIDLAAKKAQSGAFFGLAPLSIEKAIVHPEKAVVNPKVIVQPETKPEPGVVIAEKKQEKPLNTVLPIEEETEGRKRGFYWIAILLLFIGFAAAGLYFSPEIRHTIGWYTSEEKAMGLDKSDSEKAEIEKANKAKAEIALQKKAIEDSLAAVALLEGEKSSNKNNTKHKSGKVNTDPYSTDNSFDPNEKIGGKAQAGMHYLVVYSNANGRSAQEYARNMNQGKYNIKVISPFKNAYYKVTVFSSANKAEVIRKMVEWKTDFPEKSWIFSVPL